MAEIELTRRVKCAGDIHAELLKAGFTPKGAAELLERCPDADVAPVVHSRWVQVNSTQEHYCNECGADYDLYAYCKGFYNYCPHCGAKMDGGEKDAEVQA